MTHAFAFECYADAEVARFLRQACSVNFRPVHAYSQGDVINALIKPGGARVGMVDEDPRSTHHRFRDGMKVISQTPSLEIRQSHDRRLVILRPDLETCFLESIRSFGLFCAVAAEPRLLHQALGKERTRQHDSFYQDLARLYEAANSAKKRSFLQELEAAIRVAL